MNKTLTTPFMSDSSDVLIKIIWFKSSFGKPFLIKSFRLLPISNVTQQS
jgi:hypothetical protein